MPPARPRRSPPTVVPGLRPGGVHNKLFPFSPMLHVLCTGNEIVKPLKDTLPISSHTTKIYIQLFRTTLKLTL